MKKKVIVSISFSLITLLLFGLILFFYLNRVIDTNIREGKFFDDSGKQLGLCKIESKLRGLADVPKYTTYYYDLKGDNIGSCKGTGIGCHLSSQKEPKICEPVDFQKSCDKSAYPVGFGATAKYRCVLE